MPQHSKRYREAQKLIDRSKKYTAEEAVKLLQQVSKVKFDAGVEIHLNLGIDPKKADQIVRGTVSLPHGTGKKKRVAVFAEGKDADAARKAGADIAGGEELIKEIKQKGAVDFEVAIAHPSMMRHLGQIAKILGPKGLMPNPKNETVTPDVAGAVRDVQGGKVSFRNDDSGNIHQLVGRISYEAPKLVENLAAYLEAVKRARPAAAKGTYIVSATLSSSMSPGIPIVV